MSPRTVARRSACLSIEQLEDRLTLDATSFVKSLYQNLLHRAADSAGLNFWVSQINNGMTNQQVATGFWQSPEHRGVEVDTYYQTFLNRTADAAGRAFWVNQLTSGAMGELNVEFSFMTSVEFINAHPNPGAFVTALYVDLLGRAPSIAEQATWESILSIQGAGVVTFDILTSAESYTHIITGYYQTYLNRAPDTGGLSLWLSQLQTGTGTVESVAEGILGSVEYANTH
jgi:hypothetical protein